MILGADTSTSNTSIALLTDDGISEINFYGNKPNSNLLFSYFDYLMTTAQISINDIECLAIGKGPGSFTGLRISFAAFKTLSQCNDIPIALVDPFDAMLIPYRNLSGTIAVLLTARKGHAFASFYTDSKRVGTVEYLNNKEIKNVLNKSKAPVYILGSYAAEYLEFDPESVILSEKKGPLASEIVKIGYEKFKNNDTVNFEEAEPFYLRPSYAELSLNEGKG